MRSRTGESTVSSKNHLNPALQIGAWFLVLAVSGCNVSTPGSNSPTPTRRLAPKVTASAPLWPQTQREELGQIEVSGEIAKKQLKFTFENGQLVAETSEGREFTLGCGKYQDGTTVPAKKDPGFNTTVIESNFIGVGAQFNTTSSNELCADGTITNAELPKTEEHLGNVLAAFNLA